MTCLGPKHGILWTMDLEDSFKTFALDLGPLVYLSTTWSILDFVIFHYKGALMVSSSKKKGSYVCNIIMRFLAYDTMHTQGFLLSYLTTRTFISYKSLVFFMYPSPLFDVLFYSLSFVLLLFVN